MNNITDKYVTLDISLDVNIEEIKAIKIKQYNNQLQKANITITNNGKKIYLSKDNNKVDCYFKMETPDGRIIFNEAVINDDGTVTVEFSNNCSGYPGRAEAEIEIIDVANNATISTMPLNIIITECVYGNNAVTLSNEFGALENMLYKYNEIDGIFATKKDLENEVSILESSDSFLNERINTVNTTLTNSIDILRNTHNNDKNTLDKKISDEIIRATNAEKTNADTISALERAHTADKASLKSSIKSNKDAIDILNGTGEESVNGKITAAFNDFSTKVSDDAVINTYKELIDYASSHSGEFVELVGVVDIIQKNMDEHITNELNPHKVTPEQINALHKDLKGVANGVAELGENGLLVESQLPLGETGNTAYRGDRGKIAYDHSQSAHARVDATLTQASSTNGNILINGEETVVYTPEDVINSSTQAALDGISASIEAVDVKIDGLAENGLAANIDLIKEALRDVFYPIGTIYESVNATNPSEFIGGTWISWGAGRVSVGVDASQTEFNTVEKTGGEKSHVLTVNELSGHTHSIPTLSGSAVSNGGHTHEVGGVAMDDGTHAHNLDGIAELNGEHIHHLTFEQDTASGTAKNRVIPASNSGSTSGKTLPDGVHTHTLSGVAVSAGTHGHNVQGFTDKAGAHTHTITTTASTTGSTGSDTAHNNLQPYITSYKWKRTA